jgi:hypothetical protein
MEDSAYLALADACRRAVLCELLERQSIDLSDILRGNGDDSVALYHQHLPMLAEAGYIRWEPGNEHIERGDRFDVVRPLVAFHANRSRPPSATEAGATDTGPLE